jgi:protein SCO1/2
MLERIRKSIMVFIPMFLIFDFLLVVFVASKNQPKEATLPVLGIIDQFLLYDQTGSELTMDDLRGKVWVADFIFTTCAGPCPEMSEKMARLQKIFDTEPALSLVSFTVNPEYDSPVVLHEYGQRYGAKANKWIFLTGSREEIRSVATDSFHLGSKDNPVFHSTRFTLVDPTGQIRGYYDSTDQTALDKLISDAQLLLIG